MTGFHSGELAVQERAGVATRAHQLAGMVGRGELRPATAEFLAAARLAMLTARDGAGRLWISPLLGPSGFLRADTPTTLDVDFRWPAADPLHVLPAGQPAGLVVIDLAARRRIRINGVLTRAGATGMSIEVGQAYGNCPQYIHPRRLGTRGDQSTPDRIPVFTGAALRPQDRRLVERADTFFLGTTHPASGNDASHRGGPAGFVRVDGGRLSWADYPGNNLFNSLGNLAVDPSAAMVFLDFSTGTTLQLSGTAALAWHDPKSGEDHDTGREVTFTPERVVVTAIPGLHVES
ncbi:pyridoxamine 5'-phosphate oxidase family protein [Mycobacterium sp. CVI_P3]|uniref:Pyridoxamine 5'-phosphate oxidase family protein n=1 Tax=Mycobacterium pinniadriaticum TaxID=2994102 RepID=A0ABT3SHD8_9MYCO|nr:pyridoxamine 5'-phosphate oxidase family protein [Mycobacterium pinniadriaticum]MCX2932425.1 pyridoxamine 5'-phosphate oxidase family protein [Mycobacterium pinniadriaticum]MCX2938941.1 pyridoxamine 5'-phosphate oxidase family protein [Mycobacterium pinniadriaticum]